MFQIGQNVWVISEEHPGKVVGKFHLSDSPGEFYAVRLETGGYLHNTLYLSVVVCASGALAARG